MFMVLETLETLPSVLRIFLFTTLKYMFICVFLYVCIHMCVTDNSSEIHYLPGGFVGVFKELCYERGSIAIHC